MKSSKKSTQPANVAPKSNKSEIVNALADAIVRDAKQARNGSAEPTPEELAEKALKSRLANSKGILNEALKGYHLEMDDVKNHLKVFKKHLNAQYAELVQRSWTLLTIEIKKAGNCYLEEIVVKDDKQGTSKTLLSVHMCEWKDAEKTLEIGRKITPKGYRYGFEENITPVSSIKELTIERKFPRTEYVSLGIINGVENFKKVEKVEVKRMRPVEVETLSEKEFTKRLRKAWAVVFADGIEKVTNK